MASFGVNVILQKDCPCKKNDKYQVCWRVPALTSGDLRQGGGRHEGRCPLNDCWHPISVWGREWRTPARDALSVFTITTKGKSRALTLLEDNIFAHSFRDSAEIVTVWHNFWKQDLCGVSPSTERKRSPEIEVSC